MNVRLRYRSQEDVTVVVTSKVTNIKAFRRIVEDKFNIPPKSQHLTYNGRLLTDEYTLHDYGIQINDVIKLIEAPDNVCDTKDKEDEPAVPEDRDSDSEIEDEAVYSDAECELYEVGDQVDARLPECNSWYEGVIKKIVDMPGASASDTSTDDGNLLYIVKTHHDATIIPLNLSDIRPCVRTTIKLDDLSVGANVLINYNIKHPGKTGLWYDFEVVDVPKPRKRMVKGNLKRGEEVMNIEIPVKKLGKVYAVEKFKPPHERNDDYKKLMKLEPPLKERPIYCMKCKDRRDMNCDECGCSICSQKNNPEKILLCDECENGFHMSCLEVPLIQVPAGDWYCPSCKRDPNEVVAPGAAVQNRGKTKTCATPQDHFGPIPGIEVGTTWLSRKQVSEAGVHRPPVAGIHGRSKVGAFSVVVAGRFEDDMDNGDEVLYTGIGGRKHKGNKHTSSQCCDQSFDRENRSLAFNCAAPLSLQGGDAGDKWREGKPTRLIRAYKMEKRLPKYAPAEGFRYDGIYKVVKYFPEKGRSGFIVWRFLLRRDDPVPAPWEPLGKQFQLINSHGHKEPLPEKGAAVLHEKAQNKSEEPKKTSKNPKSRNTKQVPKENNPREPVEIEPNEAEEEVQPPKDTFKKTEKNKNLVEQLTVDGASSSRSRSRVHSRRNATPTNDSYASVTEVTLDGTSNSRSRSRIASRRNATPTNDSYASVTEVTLDGTSSSRSRSRIASRRNATPTNAKYSSANEVTLPGTSSSRSRSRIASRRNVTPINEKNSSASSRPQKPTESALPGSSHAVSGEPQAASVTNNVDCNDNVTGAGAMKKKCISEYVIDSKLRKAIEADKRNEKLWEQCLAVRLRGQKEFVEEVARTFMCIICEGVPIRPYTTSCKHNFCKTCIERAFKHKEPVCPLCREDLQPKPSQNKDLQEALRLIMPGYDGQRK